MGFRNLNMKKKINIKEKSQQFKVWQKQPRQVKPMSQEEHECLNCHDHYTGNFCPRCGQSANTDRFSMKVAAENFADAYGMGERGMFRTMRELILRPGYLILDYLRGMRVSYFAPFKMFFLLFAISVFVTHGLNIKGKALYDEHQTETVLQGMNEGSTAEEAVTTETDTLENDNESARLSERTKTIMYNAIEKMEHFEKRFPSIVMLLVLMLISGMLFFFFRHCPNIPDLRYSEFFIALLYTTNMYTIYSIVFDFFCLSNLSALSIFLTLIPLKQMSGYSWRRTTMKTVAAALIMLTALVLSLLLVIFCTVLLVKKFG